MILRLNRDARGIKTTPPGRCWRYSGDKLSRCFGEYLER